MISRLQKSPVTSSPPPPGPLLLTSQSQNPELRRAAVCHGQPPGEPHSFRRGGDGGVHPHPTSERPGACLRNRELSKKEAGSCPERTRGVPSADPVELAHSAGLGRSWPRREEARFHASPEPAEWPGLRAGHGSCPSPHQKARALSAAPGLGREVKRKEHIHSLSELVPQHLVTPK